MGASLMDDALAMGYEAIQARILANVDAAVLWRAREPGPVVRMYWAPGGPGNRDHGNGTTEQALRAWAAGEGLRVEYSALFDQFAFWRIDDDH